MTIFHLLRHGEPDFNLLNPYPVSGWGVDIAPLRKAGREQIERYAQEVESRNFSALLCSPMTRAVESAAILSRKLNLPLCVHFDLHEWIPAIDQSWKDAGEVRALQDDFWENSGEWPAGGSACWEPLSSVRARVSSVLEGYLHHKEVLVVAHEVVIFSLTEQRVGYARSACFEIQGSR